MTSTRFRPVLALAVAALAVAGCAGPAPKVTAAPGVTAAKDCGTVSMAINPWVGYEANAAVVSYLMREELRCTVKTAKIDEVTAWKQLAAGRIDVILENWGHDAEKKQYVDTEGVAVEGGLTGNTGVIGWYVPPWMVKTYPDIVNWKNLNKYSDLFRTARSGGRGQILDGDPTYVTNDKALVKNLGLNYTVVYAGSEAALINAFRRAEKDRKPLLGYFYSPQWLLSEIDLKHVALPAYTPGCDADPKKLTCDYQPFDLDKIMNRRFAYSGSPAATLVRNFQWTNDDQNEVARSITELKLTPDEAAKKWLDANPTVWKKWLTDLPE